MANDDPVPVDETSEEPHMLTLEELEAGKPCPGCGRPYRDEEPWTSKGSMHYSPEERERYEAEDARFQRYHGSCQAARFSHEGSLTMHCGACCPPPPMSVERAEMIAGILLQSR